MKAFDLEADIKIDIANATASLDTLIKKAKELNTELNVPKSAGGGTSGSGTSAAATYETESGKSTGIDSSMSVTLGNLSASAIRAIGGAIKGAISKSFDYNIERDSYISSLQTIMNTSREEATALFDNLAKISLDTPLNQSSIGYASERLMNFGFPREGLEEMIIDLGNLSRGDNEKMERITKALSDTLSKQALLAQERNQFADAGIDIWGLLDAYYSATDESWAAMTKEERTHQLGYRQYVKAIPAADVVAAIQYASDTPGMPYYNAMELAMNTTGGALERAGEAGLQYGATALKEYGIMDLAKWFGNNMADYFEEQKRQLEENDPWFVRSDYEKTRAFFALLRNQAENAVGEDDKILALLQPYLNDPTYARDAEDAFGDYQYYNDLSYITDFLDDFYSTEEVDSMIQSAIQASIPSAIAEGFRGAKVQVTVGTGNVVLDSGTLVGALTPKVNVSLGGLLGNA